MSRFKVYQEYGPEVVKGNKLTSFRQEVWTFESCTHPRKVNVSQPVVDEPYIYDNHREFYANVFDVGIWDTKSNEWTFAPPTHQDDSANSCCNWCEHLAGQCICTPKT